MILGGCTSLVQPIEVSINLPFKDILKVKKGKRKRGGDGGTYLLSIKY